MDEIEGSAAQSARATTKRGADTGLPADVVSKFEVVSYRHASTILKYDFPQEYSEFIQTLQSFTLRYSQVVIGGGGKGPIAVEFDTRLTAFGWGEKQISVAQVVDGVRHDSPGHKIDLFKNRIAIEMEWNNKTEFYDRDLDNFRKLHSLGVISVGVIVTRSTLGLNRLFHRIDQLLAELPFEYYRKRGKREEVRSVSPKYGASTTHANKIYPKIEGGAGGQCPILVLGITDAADDKGGIFGGRV